MRALVTGGAGFVGSTLVDRLLAEGHAVDVVDDLTSGSLANLANARASGGALSFHRLDIKEPDLVDLIVRRRPDVVYHLATARRAAASVHRPVEDVELSLAGSLRVLEGARDAAAAKVVVALPGADLYGALSEDQLPSAETDRGAPRSPLSVSTRALLDYLELYRLRSGLDYSALALGEVYGDRERGGRPASVRSLVAALASGSAWTIQGDGSATRDFVHVDDVVDALSRASTDGSGLLVNIGTGVATSLSDLYRIAARATGARLEPYFAAWPEGEVLHSCLAVSRAEVHLGWRSWTTLEAGVVDLLGSIDVARRAPGQQVRG